MHSEIIQVNPQPLKPHPKGADYYGDLPAEKYEQIKNSIEANGIRDPLWVTTDNVVIRGHQRLKIALELGLETVPVEIKDVTPDEAKYLMIADNDERRQSDDDPIRQANRIKDLKEYWGIKRGGDRKSIPQNEDLKTNSDVAKLVGVDVHNMGRILKLLDLIPELQAMVSSGKLGKTVAEHIAQLTADEQLKLYNTWGDSLAKMTVAEITDLLKEMKKIEEQTEEQTEEYIVEVESVLPDNEDVEENKPAENNPSKMNQELTDDVSVEEDPTDQASVNTQYVLGKNRIRSMFLSLDHSMQAVQRSIKQIKKEMQEIRSNSGDLSTYEDYAYCKNYATNYANKLEKAAQKIRDLVTTKVEDIEDVESSDKGAELVKDSMAPKPN